MRPLSDAMHEWKQLSLGERQTVLGFKNIFTINWLTLETYVAVFNYKHVQTISYFFYVCQTVSNVRP